MGVEGSGGVVSWGFKGVVSGGSGELVLRKVERWGEGRAINMI